MSKREQPTILLRGMGLVNKGASLMLISVLQAMRKRYPKARIAMIPSGQSSYLKRAELSLYQYPSFRKFGIGWEFLLNLLPAWLLDHFGIVLARDVDCVLDGSGYSLGDYWRIEPMQELHAQVRKWYHLDIPVILLPQAFGPFTGKKNQKLMRDILRDSTLVYPREETSLHYLADIGADISTLSVFPDFTCLQTTEGKERDPKRFTVIPNAKMTMQKLGLGRKGYLDLLVSSIESARSFGVNPVLLNHEGERDRKICEDVNHQLSESVPIVEFEDPIAIKQYIGSSHAVLSSRFHGLVSALSQGVPVISTSWSHKYEELLGSYGMARYIYTSDSEDGKLVNLIADVVDEQKNAAISARLAIRSEEIRKSVLEMWEQVYSVIDYKING